jgi:hypothetical protein
LATPFLFFFNIWDRFLSSGIFQSSSYRLSDIHGIRIVNLTGSPTSRKQLVGKLKVAGVRYDDSGSDWLKHGKFS